MSAYGMRSWGEAASGGIESGFKMGMDWDAAQEKKRALGVQEARQAEQDKRAADDLSIRQSREGREQDRQDRIEQNMAADRASAALAADQKDIEQTAAGAQANGDAVSPDLGTRYADVKKKQATLRQSALDYWDRARTAQFNPLTTPPAELYKNFVAGTGMTPEDMQQMPQHIADVQSGIKTGNQSVLLQGVNGVLAPQLKVGVGEPSPHGGTIVRKEIIGLDPAIDANGQSHPNRVIPRLRVYVDTGGGSDSAPAAPAPPAKGLLEPGNIDLHNRKVVHNADGSISTVRSMGVNIDGKEVLIPTTADDGSRILSDDEAIAQYKRTGKHLGVFDTPKNSDAYAEQLHEDQAKEYLPGEEQGQNIKYYDAPLTQNRTSDPNDPVVALDMDHAMDWMGNLGVAANLVQHPEIQAKLAQGAKELDPATAQALNDLTNKTRPGKSSMGPYGQKISDINAIAKQQGISPEDVMRKYDSVLSTGVGAATLRAKLDTIDSLDISDEEKDKLKRDIAIGAGGKTTGLVPIAVGKNSRVVGGPAGLAGASGGGSSAGGAKAASSAAASKSGVSARFDSDPVYARRVDYWADVLAKGGKFPPGFAKNSPELSKDATARVPDISLNSNEMIGNQAEVNGLNAGARAVGTRAATFGMAQSEANEMANLVKDASAKVPRTNWMPINKVLIAYKENRGDVPTRQLGASLLSFINAYARAINPQGVGTVSDKEHARKILETADGDEALSGIIDQLKLEMAAAGRAPGIVRGEQRTAAQGITAGGLKVPGNAPAAPAQSAAPQRTATNPKTGEKLMLQDGQWVPFK